MWVVFCPSCPLCFNMEICPVPPQIYQCFMYLPFSRNSPKPWFANTLPSDWQHLYECIPFVFLWWHFIGFREERKVTVPVGRPSWTWTPWSSTARAAGTPQWPQILFLSFPSLCLAALLPCYVSALFPASMRSLVYWPHLCSFLTIFSLCHGLIN